MSTRVDAHVHVWQMPSVAHPWQPLRNMHPSEPAPVEALLQAMDAGAVQRAVIVQPSNYGYDHSYVAACLARYPTRLAGVALLDFRAPDAAKQIVRLAGAGFGGIRLFLYHEPDLAWLSNAATGRVLRAAAGAGMVVCCFGRWNMLSALGALAQEHTSLRFVLDHLGHPDVNEPPTWQAVLGLAALPNIYIKVSDFPTLSRRAYPYADVFPFVVEALSAFGARRMMWASNWPNVLRHSDYGPLPALVDAALPGLSHVERGWLLGGTADSLWPPPA